MNNDTRDDDIDDIDDIDTLIEEDDNDSLTTKWLDEIEAHNMNYDSFYKDDVFFIKFCKIYVSGEKKIERVSCERIDLEEKNMVTYKEFAKIISENNHQSKKKYRVFRAYMYNMDTEPEDLVKFIKFGEFRPLVREINVHDSLRIKETISQFQRLNTIYIIFKEVVPASLSKKTTRKTSRVSFGSKTRKIVPKI
jgi:hypothetical protein